MPRPRSVITVPGCVPAGTSTSSSPSSVGTETVVPERRVRRRQVDHGDQVVAVAHEALVLGHLHEHVEVAGRAAVVAGVAAARHAGCAARRRCPAGMSTSSVRVRSHAARAPRTRRTAACGTLPSPPQTSQACVRTSCPNAVRDTIRSWPSALAAAAGLDRRARLGAVAVAVLAAVDQLVLDLHLAPRWRPAPA